MSNHLLIAGTGRAGTSFLVRYLARLGLQTTLSQPGRHAEWNDRANAGLEDLPLPLTDATTLPYVIKSPATYQYIQELLGNPALHLDAVIIPVRNLAEAAASRCVLELQNIHAGLPWMSDLAQTWEHFDHTPGGVVYSLNPLDEARLLAVGFHHLLNHLVAADIPVILLAFPRFIEDPDYLFRKVFAVLPATITADRAAAGKAAAGQAAAGEAAAGEAAAAHAATADPAKIRIGPELRDAACAPGLQTHGPGFAQLDRIALARLLTETRQNLAAAQAELAARRQALDLLYRDLAAARSDITAHGHEQARLARELAVTQEALQISRAALDALATSPTWRAAQRLRRAANRIPLCPSLIRLIFRGLG